MFSKSNSGTMREWGQGQWKLWSGPEVLELDTAERGPFTGQRATLSDLTHPSGQVLSQLP